MGRGVGDHLGRLRLHQPHRAARGARALAGEPPRPSPAAASAAHLRDQPALPRPGARALRRRRCAVPPHVDHRGGARSARAHGEPRRGRQPRGQRGGGAAHRDPPVRGLPGLRRALAGQVQQQDQRHHPAALAPQEQPGAGRADHRRRRRRLGHRPLRAREAGASRLRRRLRQPLARRQASEQASTGRHAPPPVRAARHADPDRPGFALRRAGQAHPRVQAAAPERAARHHALQPHQGQPAPRHGAAHGHLRRQGRARLRHRQAHHPADQRRRRRGRTTTPPCATG